MDHPGTVPRFVISSVIGRTQVKTDALPHYPNNCQIMAEAEDPTADAPDLDARLNEKTAALDGDEGFRNAIKMCEYSTAYTKRILDHFDDPGFGSLTDKLNRDSGGFFRHVVREDNKKILAENQKLTDNKEKELLQPQV